MDTTEEPGKTYKKEIIIGAAVILGAVAIITAIAFAIYFSAPKMAFQPAKACDLLTSAETRELLGGKAVKTGIKDPVVSGNTATSSCGYTNGNADMDKAVVAAVSVRSGINDDGVTQNETEFAAGKPKNAKDVKDVGDSAYWNDETGQLNVLSGRKWVIVSYGMGAAPEANTLDDAVKLAEKVLH